MRGLRQTNQHPSRHLTTAEASVLLRTDVRKGADGVPLYQTTVIACP